MDGRDYSGPNAGSSSESEGGPTSTCGSSCNPGTSTRAPAHDGNPAWRQDAESFLARVEAEYDRAHARFDALDGKSALVLGFAATLLALTFDVPPEQVAAWAVTAARLAGMAAIVAALGAAWPRHFTAANLAKHRAALAEPDSVDVLVAVIDSRIGHVASVAKACDSKLKMLRVALVALTAEAALVGLGASLS
jgi:hypothetical protein